MYDLVWAEPVAKVAERFGMTGRGLAKLCERRQVPVPPRGYWMRLEMDRGAFKVDLPGFVGPTAKPERRAQRLNTKDRRSADLHTLIGQIEKAEHPSDEPDPPTCGYSFRVDEWGWSYSVGLQGRQPEWDAAREEDVHPEFEDIRLNGILQEPVNLAGRPVSLNVVPAGGYSPIFFRKTHRAHVGAIEFSEGQVFARAAVPESAASRLLQILIAGQMVKVTLVTEPDGQEEQMIVTVSFEMEHP